MDHALRFHQSVRMSHVLRFWVVALIYLLSHVPSVESWRQLETTGRCWDFLCADFPDHSCNCSLDIPTPRRGQSAANNGTHLLIFGGQTGIFVNNSINQGIGEDPPVIRDALELAEITNATHTRWARAVSLGCTGDMHGCFARGECSVNATCVCDKNFFGVDCSNQEELVVLDDLWILDFVEAQWIQVPKVREMNFILSVANSNYNDAIHLF